MTGRPPGRGRRAGARPEHSPLALQSTPRTSAAGSRGAGRPARDKHTGYGRKYREARGQSPTLTLRFQTPPLQRCTHRTPGCAPLKRRRHSPARSTCAAAPVLRSSPLGADMVSKSRNMSADMLFMPGLLALMPPTICCVRSQSVRDLVTEISGGATPHRCGVAQSSSSELATQAWPSQPHSRLVVPVHVGSRLAYSGSPTHSRTPTPTDT